MPESYSPKYVEAIWYQWWEKCGFFSPEYWMSREDPHKPRKKFVMVIPPPNVTGNLHLGHALTNSLEDAITRWHRMRGEITVWVPGCDHAGIATQVVVEKRLWRERQVTRHDIGREAFLQEVWKWKEEKGGNIYHQLKSLGSSCDWSRAAFTMNPKLSHAVTEAFVRMYEHGLIYRGVRLVNWCCTLQSAISEIEVEKRELTGRTAISVPGYPKPVIFGILASFAYPLVESPNGEELIVATTRLETMVGDTGVAVHPEDPRYSHLIGRFVQHPFIPERRMPIVGDTFVDQEFGTGAVKLTPAHDHTDYEVGLRHNLPFVTVIDENGCMTKEAGPFAGMKRFEARWAIRKALEEKGLFRGEVDNPMVVPICSRTKDVIEPLLKPQWYVRCQELADRAIKEVADGNLKIMPRMYVRTWNNWLRDCHDWCISRQLWWGHRVPAYQVALRSSDEEFTVLESSENDSWVVARDEKEALAIAAERFKRPVDDIRLMQDEDVLDTWFSSQLFPMSVFGWPDTECSDFRTFYPGSLLETGHDILFFWVARMVMCGLFFTDRLPFTEVYLHAMIRDAHGKKMSKSLGNAIDPVDVINGISLPDLQAKLLVGNLDPAELTRATAAQAKDYPKGIPECGTDALRFALCSYRTRGWSINLNILRVQGYRFFCNKLWNAVRYAIYHCLQSGYKPPRSTATLSFSSSGEHNLSGTDQWILSCLAHAVQECNAGFKEYQFPRATTACFNFWLYEFCDVYLEYSKPLVKLEPGCSPDAQKRAEVVRHVVYTCLDLGLRMLHPFMPFVTEELYQRLPRRDPPNDPPSICVAPYPDDDEIAGWQEDPTVTISFRLAFSLVHRLRSLYATYNLGKTTTLPEAVLVAPESTLKGLRAGKFLVDIVEALGKCRLTDVTTDKSLANTTGCIMATVSATDACVEEQPATEATGENEQGEEQAMAAEDEEEEAAAATPGAALPLVVPTCQLYLRLAGLIDAKAEVERTEQRVAQLRKSIEALQKVRSRPEYTVKVPQTKQAADAAKLHTMELEVAGLIEVAESLRILDAGTEGPRCEEEQHPLLRLVGCFATSGKNQPSSGDNSSGLEKQQLFDLQAQAEALSDIHLLGGNDVRVRADVKQLVAWSLRLLPPPPHHQQPHKGDPGLLKAWQSYYEQRLERASPAFLAGTSRPSLADLAALLVITQHKLVLNSLAGRQWSEKLTSQSTVSELLKML
ncbi:hypothetical protein SprV_0702377600 [Sparganum proliferum]